MPSIRLSFLLIAAFCGVAIIAALIMQHVFGMEPCPLCISQRIFIMLVGISALIGAVLSERALWYRIIAALGIVFTLIGASVSARHVWIQNLPEDEVPLCGPGLAYMFETRPLFDALTLLFSGDGNCAEVSFLFLGLSIPAWTLVAFLALAVALLWLVRQSFRQKAIGV